jgi:dolichol-phosphate mannosyltransferase
MNAAPDNEREAGQGSPPEACISSRVVVVLCTYNEVENLPKLFGQLDEHLPHADRLVVDDNSPDGTSEWVLSRRQTELDTNGRPQTNLLRRSGKLGLGTALRDGIRWCLEQDFEFLINLDADISHQPLAAPEMLRLARTEKLDVVVGTRYAAGGSSPGLPLHRKVISRCLNSYALRILGLPITDCSGSYRCYRVSKLRELDLTQLTCPGYGFLEEILVALKRKDARFGEVPIAFDCRYAGESKLSLNDALGAIRTIHRLAIRGR